MADEKPTFWQDLTWRAETAAYDVLVGTLGLLPIDAISAFGGGLLKTLGPLVPAQRTARKNLRIAFPDKDPAWIDRMVRAQWENVGRTFIETPFLHRIFDDPSRLEVIGQEHLEEIARSGKAAVLISGHIANWEIMAGVIVRAGVECLISYRPINNPYFDQRVREARRRSGMTNMAPKSASAVRSMIEGLRNGVSLAILSDQRHDEGVPVPFFGLDAFTNPIAARLALHADTVIQPIAVERLEGARYRVTVPPPITPVKTGDREKDIAAALAQINGFIEERIRLHPDQYFWVHRRWPKPTYQEAA